MESTSHTHLLPGGRSRKITPDEESHFKGWGLEREKDKGIHLASAINPTRQRQCWNESHLSCSTMKKWRHFLKAWGFLGLLRSRGSAIVLIGSKAILEMKAGLQRERVVTLTWGQSQTTDPWHPELQAQDLWELSCLQCVSAGGQVSMWHLPNWNWPACGKLECRGKCGLKYVNNVSQEQFLPRIVAVGMFWHLFGRENVACFAKALQESGC